MQDVSYNQNIDRLRPEVNFNKPVKVRVQMTNDDDLREARVMVLTEEQRLRMESNRRTALQRLKHATLPCAKPDVKTVGTTSSAGSTNFPPSTSFQSTKLQCKINSKTSRPSKPLKPPVVRCRLKSRETFEVLADYHTSLVEMFRSMPKEKSAYAACVEKLQPPVQFEGLPPVALRVLKGQKARPVSDEELESIDSTIYGRLFLFQKHALRFIISRNGRVLLADEMGLGKTIEALAAAVYYKSEWPLLIVCPSSVKCTWAEEIAENVPSLDPSSICVVNSSAENVLGNAEYQVFILSYDFMVNMEEQLTEKQFKIIIMDECHNIKNFKTRRYQAAHKLLKRARRALLLSGTPALSKPSELYTQISCVAPNIFRSFKEFGERYCNPRQVRIGGRTIWKYSGASNLEELQLLLKETIMLRRSKEEVLSELPPKIRKTVVLSKQIIGPRLGSLQEIRRFYENSKRMHEALLPFYRETAQVKLPAIIEYISDLVDAGKKFIVFAHHQVIMDALSSLFASKKVHAIRIDGSVSSEKRKIYCDKFQNSDDVRVALLSITAASTGITLTASRLVVFAELFWNPGVLIQAEDRAHRVGQLDSVLVEYLVAKGTADDQLWVMLKRKLEILKKGGLSGESFTATDNATSPCTSDAANFDNMHKSRIAKRDAGQRSLNDFLVPEEVGKLESKRK
ncbi:SWI:SNF matrix associated [Trichuris trichiura]|uniref:SWI:SNF matrix associated n=1 Tax=Trichuris trichiura TaxID=36087 RepID=A0A077Z9Z1_TRITR|nr:SWI:SNF matrix associated [Trichuris trichiura]